MINKEYRTIDKDGRVERKEACPQCGESQVKSLLIAEDGITIDCASCGCVFVPD